MDFTKDELKQIIVEAIIEAENKTAHRSCDELLERARKRFGIQTTFV